MNLSRYISFKEETVSLISEFDIDEILSIHSLPVSIESEHLNFDRALVKQFTQSLPRDEQGRALALLLDYSTVIDTDPALCEFSVCLRQLVAIGYFMPQLLRRNQMKFLESVKIILGRLFAEFPSKKHFAHQCSMALAYVISPLAKRMNDVDITNPRYKIYQDILELLLELYKNEDFFTVKEIPRFLPFFFNSIGAFQSDSGEPYTATQIQIFNDLLDLLYKYVDKSVTMDIQVFDVIRNIVQIITTKSLPLAPSIRLIVFLNSLSRLNDEIANFIFNSERCSRISTFLVSTIKLVDFSIKKHQENSINQTPILDGNKNYFSLINHPTKRTFSNDISSIPLENRSTNQKIAIVPVTVPECINGNVDIIQIIMGALQLFNTGGKSFRSEFHKTFINNLLADEELKKLPVFPYFLATWLYQFIASDISPVIEALHQTNFYYTLYLYAFIKTPDEILQEFVANTLNHLIDKYHISNPYFLSDFLIFAVDYSKLLEVNPKIFNCLTKSSVDSTITFIRACTMTNISTKFANLLSELAYLHQDLIQKRESNSNDFDLSLLVKLETTRKQLLSFVDSIDSFPTIFQYFFDNVEYTKVILCHIYDDSTINFTSVQLILLFEQFTAKSDTFLMVVKFFSTFEITNPILLILLQCCSRGFDANPYEIADIFNNTNFLDFLIESSVRLKCDVALEILLNIFSKMTAKQAYFSFKFDIFLKVENLVQDNFDTSSLWKIVFGDDQGNTIPRKIVNTSPISLLFAISIQKDEIKEFIEFITKCFDLDEYIIYDLCQSELPARILRFLSEYRTKEEKDEKFDIVFDFFVYISIFSMKNSDLCSLIRLCTSLPGHKRPFFTTNIIRAIEILLKETENLPSAFFDLCGEKTYLQLQNVPIEIINKDFTLYFDLRFLKDRFLGTIVEFANSSSKISIKYVYDKIEIFIKNGKQEYKDSRKVPLDTTKFSYFIIGYNYKPNSILILYNNNSYIYQHEPFLFETDFSYFKALDNVPCQLSRTFLSKKVFNTNETKLLTVLPYSPVASFHITEAARFPPSFLSLFKPSIAPDFLFIFNAQVSLKRFAINLIDSSTMRVTGRIIQTEPQLLMLLDSIGGFLALMPFFGQIEQPLVGGKEAKDDLLPTLLSFFTSVLGMTTQNQRTFRKVGGAKILAFLLSLVSLEKLQSDKTIDAICELFPKLTFIPLSVQFIDYILLNFKLWIYLPIERQKTIYKKFIDMIIEKLNGKFTKSYLNGFNISKIMTLMRVYLWTNRTNKKICLENDTKMDIEGKKIDGKRPDDCSQLRNFFWDIIKKLSDDYLREEDFDLLLSFCSDALDLDFTRESVDMFSYLMNRKNPIAILFMKKKNRFSTLFGLFKVPDPTLIKKVFKIYLNIDNSFLLPFKKEDWDNGIVREIDSKSVDIDLLKIIERNMIKPREAHLSAHDTANLAISEPRFISLYILAVQAQDEENMMKYFDLIDDLMKMDAALLKGNWDHPFLLLLMAQMPNENAEMNQISRNTIELLAFLYNKSCRSKPKKNSLQLNSTISQNSTFSSFSPASQFFSMPQFVQIVSCQAKKDYSYIIRLIYIEFLKKENLAARPYSLIEPATFSKIYLQIAKFIMIVPNFDNSAKDVNYTYQDLLKLSQKSLSSSFDGSSSNSLYLSQPGSSLSSDNFKSLRGSSDNMISFDDSDLNSSEFVSTTNLPSSFNLDSVHSSYASESPIILSSSNDSFASNVSNNASSVVGLSPLVSGNMNALQTFNPITTPQKQEHVVNRQIHKLFNFTHSSREINNMDTREWCDSSLAALLIDALISRAVPILSVKEKTTVNRKNSIHPLELLGFLIKTGLSFQSDQLEFANLADLALSMFQTIEHIKAHIKRSINYIFYGLVKAVIENVKNNSLYKNPSNKRMAEILLKNSKNYSDFLQKEYKIVIPMIKLDEFNFESVFAPIYEDENHMQTKFLKLIKNEINKTESQIDILSKKLCFSSQLIPKLKNGQLPRDQLLRNNLEQFALLRLNENITSMKTYKKLFRVLSSRNGPWQTPEVEVVTHRKMSENYFGWCHFFLKPNYKYTDHKDASLLRDIGSKEDATEAYNQQFAKERTNEFKGDLALAAVEKSQLSNTSINLSNDAALLKLDACNITISSVNSGKLSVTQSFIIFDSPHRFIQIQLETITKIFLRRYLHVNSSIEIFTTLKKSYFFDFVSSEQRSIFLEFINDRHLETLKFIQMTDNDIVPLLSRAIHDWQNGKLTNFDYLLKLNKYSGRTYHDLSQYPVFPWIISDYTSDVLDLTKPETFRDLSKPMGAMNEGRLNDLKSRISTDDKHDEMTNFLYGALYSSSATVIGYLIRMEPFTSLHIDLQNGKFDVGDRLFISIPEAWKSATSSQMDFRELTPEFFYLPDFLVNENKLDLGICKKTNEKINDVILPKWAKSPLDFVSKNRKALEDPFVTLYLPQWINLIFGPNSRLPNSEKVNNVFHPYYYDTSIVGKTDSEIEIIREYTACFGSAPRQLFIDEPPQRNFSPILFTNVFFGEEKFVELCPESSIIALSPDCGSVMNVALNSDLDFFIGGQARGHLQLRMPTELEDICKVGQRAVVSTHSAVVALPWDCAIYIFRFEGVNVEPSMISRAHNKKITALAISDEYIATGSEDCTVRIWDNKKMKHLHCVSKHRAAISALEINQKLRICVAASSDGYISVNSLVNWDFCWDAFIDLKEPSSITVSDFGFIVIAQNGPTNGSYSVVYDQNLKFICNKNFEPSWIIARAISWNDGMDYLAVAMSDNLIHFYVLPFMEPISSTINTADYTVTSLAFHKDEMRMIIGDSMGKIHIHRFLH
ncbi:hypothetical protein M9Y10_000912 [Tritrichomonas musculus]|uniref:BEACH domain-containing protein n=1 Tax=Tritrichomonas musculus TaxID=1915356 RepID=A0ABR2L5H6_9EUKA